MKIQPGVAARTNQMAQRAVPMMVFLASSRAPPVMFITMRDHNLPKDISKVPIEVTDCFPLSQPVLVPYTMTVVIT